MNKNIKIKNISVTRLGPIDNFNLEPGYFNLIYGKNETGKTALIEFIIRSLFTSPGSWNLRELGGEGKITIGGLTDKDKNFSPSSKKKIKHYMEKEGPGLSPGLEKLLVVKGARAEISDSPAGVDAGSIKRLLSERETLERIEKKIPSAFGKAVIESDFIDIKKSTNDARDMFAAGQDLEKIDRLMEDISNNYTRGPVISIDRELKDVEEKIKEQNLALRHRGYILSRRAEQLKQKRKELNPEKADILSGKIIEYRTAEENIRREEERLEEARRRCREYEWLARAAETYGDILKGGKSAALGQSVFIAAALLITALIPLFGASSIVPPAAAVFFAVLFVFLRRKGVFAGTNAASGELKAVRKKYGELFGTKLKSFSDLKVKLAEAEKYRDRARDIEENLKEPRRRLENLESEIKGIFMSTVSETPEPESWEEEAKNIKKKIRKTDEDLSEVEKKLAALNLDTQDYIKEYSGQKYSEEELRELNEKKAELEDKKKKYLDSVQDLKNRIIQETGADITESFNELIDKLRNKRETVGGRLKELRAKIIGLNLLHKVIEELKSAEEEKIKESLSSDIVQSPLKEVTGRYSSLKIENDKVLVSDKYRDYDIGDISTGTIEQILIALRMGISRKVMGGRKMFFIFDDAFQHTDWTRREYMTDVLVGAAASGWQLFYFTMDDHIRDLLKKKGSKLKTKFVFCEI
ncbi:MAG: hypothetical protein U9R36_01065 [Elusimicrobiota bacterium]|nr:hypothetical protein [Elusimicrobiota bacterium]